ncbi:unnamed protein product [Symbiodinium sp. CCMP2592]|nr:unnamed protein product [Symbiodinium sp. CCMP2592]
MQSSPPVRASAQFTPDRPTQLTTPERPKKLRAKNIYVGTGSLDSLDTPGLDKKSGDISPTQKPKRKRRSSENPKPFKSHDDGSQNKKTKTNDEAAERAKCPSQDDLGHTPSEGCVQVTMKALHHTFLLLTGKGLDFFIPKWARPSRDLFKGENMMKAELGSIDEMGLLRFEPLQVADEEGVQNKCFHFLHSYIGVRGAISPEICHPKWNCWKRAVKHTGMNFDLMRLTIAANYGHGSKITGERVTMRQEYLETWLGKQDEQYFEEISEEINHDRGERGMTSDAVQTSIAEFLEAPLIKRRAHYAKNKSWFGCLTCFKMLLRDWTVLREAARAVVVESAGMAPCPESTRAENGMAGLVGGIHHMNSQGCCEAWHSLGFGQRQILKSADEEELQAGAAVDEAEDVDEAAEAEEAAEGAPEKQSKSDYYAAYKSKGPHQMQLDILSDDRLRCSAEILCRVTRPLHKLYQSDLQAQKEGLEKTLQWNAERCVGSSLEACNQILTTTSNPALYMAMKMTPHCNPCATPDMLPEEMELAQKAFSFATNLAGNFAWSEMLHQFTLPLAAGSLLLADREKAQRALHRIGAIIDAVVKAEDMLRTKPALGQLLQDLAFQEESLAREVMIRLRRAKYKLDDPEAQTVVRLMRSFFGGSSSTKEILESCFGHLADVVSRSNKNKCTSRMGLWLYCTSSGFIKSSGMKQRLPDRSDWLRWLEKFGSAKDEWMQKFNTAFNVAATALPQAQDMEFPKTAEGVVKTKWRLAGPLSHYRSAAAACYLLKESDIFMISLGFVGWCALGMKLRRHKVGQQEFLSVDPNHQGVEMLFNFTVSAESSAWMFVVHEVLPPACVPDSLHQLGSCIHVKSKEGILRAAVLRQQSMKLTKDQLVQICTSLRVPLPDPKKGSGKRGNRIKIDFVRALVRYLLPDSPDEVEERVAALMGKQAARLDMGVLAMISEMDVDNADSFKELKKQAMQQFEEEVSKTGEKRAVKSMKDAEARAEAERKVAEAAKKREEKQEQQQAAERKRQWELTPPDLKKLLPGGGAITSTFWMRFQPLQKFWKVEYPIGSLTDYDFKFQNPSSDPIEKDSCQRSWGTKRCPDQLSALREVLSFTYRRWNARNPHNKFEMPSDDILKTYIETLPAPSRR